VRDYAETDPAAFAAALGDGRIAKSFVVAGDRLTVRYDSDGASGRLEIRLNIAMPSCDGYLGRYILENGDIPCGFGDRLELPAARRLTLDDGVLGGSLVIAVDTAIALTAQAHRTVSQSEAGFEKIMQAVELTGHWLLDGAPRSLTFTIEARARPA